MRGVIGTDALADIYRAIGNSYRCSSGKVQIKKRRDAQAEATRLNKLGNDRRPGEFARAYECKFCGWWHVGRSSLK